MNTKANSPWYTWLTIMIVAAVTWGACRLSPSVPFVAAVVGADDSLPARGKCLAAAVDRIVDETYVVLLVGPGETEYVYAVMTGQPRPGTRGCLAETPATPSFVPDRELTARVQGRVQAKMKALRARTARPIAP